MKKNLLTLLGNSSWPYFAKTSIILLISCTLFAVTLSSAQQVSSQGPDRRKAVEIAGVKFVSPPDFELEHSPATNVAFMRHTAQQIALFVTVLDRQVDDKYLTDLSSGLVSRFLPERHGFEWKVLQGHSDCRKSIHQTGCGTTKGLNAKTFVQIDYVVVKAQGHDIIVGYIAAFGDERDAKFLFDVDGREYSFLGWKSLFHLIASVTGEKFDESL
jgi:hypothetical protein